MKVRETIELLESGKEDKLMGLLYGEDGIKENVIRYSKLLKGYASAFGPIHS